MPGKVETDFQRWAISYTRFSDASDDHLLTFFLFPTFQNLQKVRLSTLVSVTLEERRGSLTLVSHHHLDHHHCHRHDNHHDHDDQVLGLKENHHDHDHQVLGLKEGRLVMRRTEGIREWQRGLQRLSGHYPQCAHYKLTIGGVVLGIMMMIITLMMMTRGHCLT